jgi:lipopolysaccharide biosynthesis glycosyltransferase
MLHFDLDALCLTDIAGLYDVDMEGCGIASTPEPQPWYSSGFETYRRSSNRLRREGTPELARELITRTHGKDRFDFLIFNAGIMVMDLAKMREDDFCGRYLAYVQKYGVNGQVVLNAYVGNNLKDVGADWNRLMRLEIAEHPKIAHWAGPFKPWHKHVYVTGRELWLDGEERFAERARRAGIVEAEAAPAK